MLGLAMAEFLTGLFLKKKDFDVGDRRDSFYSGINSKCI